MKKLAIAVCIVFCILSCGDSSNNNTRLRTDSLPDTSNHLEHRTDTSKGTDTTIPKNTGTQNPVRY